MAGRLEIARAGIVMFRRLGFMKGKGLVGVGTIFGKSVCFQHGGWGFQGE